MNDIRLYCMKNEENLHDLNTGISYLHCQCVCVCVCILHSNALLHNTQMKCENVTILCVGKRLAYEINWATWQKA